MTYSTTARSPSAILVGVLFTGVTAWVLLDDVRHGAAFNTKHLMTMAVLAGTVYFGHAFWSELRSIRLGNMLGCAILFLAGTATCVLMSAGRNAEVITTKALTASNGNAERQRVLDDRAEAKARYDAALAAETGECSGGAGPKCSAKRITTMLRREDYAKADAAVRVLPAEQVANGDIRAGAELVARLPYVTADVRSIEASLQLLYPFLMSLFCEIAAVVGFSMGLGHRKVQAPQAEPQRALPAPSQEPLGVSGTVSSTPLEGEIVGWTPRSVEEARELARRARAEEVFTALRESAPLSNDELAARLNLSKGDTSRKVTALSQAGLICRRRAGRYVAISLQPLR